MVVRRVIACLMLVFALPARAQTYCYATADTTSVYPNWGTYYHNRFEGRKTSSGEIFDQNRFTAAHWKIELGTLILVTNANSGKTVIVKVNDRCPKHGVIDLSHRAAHAIGIRGCQRVTVRLLPDGYLEQWAAQEELFDSVYTTLGPSGTKTATDTEIKKTTVQDGGKHIKKSNSSKSLTQDNGRYCVVLGTASSHGDAFLKINKLPERYADHILVEPLSGSDDLLLVLDVRMTKTKAEEFCRTHKKAFPHCSVQLCN